MASFETRVDLAAPPEVLFDYLTKPENVSKLTAPEAGMKLISAPDPFEAGGQIHLELTGFGPPQKLVFEITEFSRPTRFVERQAKGPLKSLVQEHLFEEIEGGTRLIEKIEFQPPGGMLGFLVTEDRVRKGLMAGFQYRHRQLKSHFGGLD